MVMSTLSCHSRERCVGNWRCELEAYCWCETGNDKTETYELPDTGGLEARVGETDGYSETNYTGGHDNRTRYIIYQFWMQRNDTELRGVLLLIDQ
jgi:hypothetical protein